MISNISEKFTRNEVNRICVKSKQTGDKFPLSDYQASSIFYLIHYDIWGPYRTSSSCGGSYFLTITDDYSRAIWIYLMKEKTEVLITLKNFIALVEKQYNKCVKMV